MKVLIIHNAGSRQAMSGELVVVQNEFAALQKVGIESKLHVVYNDQIDFHKPWRALMIGLQVFWSHDSYVFVNGLIKQFHPDLVHFHGILPILSPAVFYACNKNMVPVIQTLHNFRWICLEGGLFKKGKYCDQCIGRSGWAGVVHGCARNSRLISLFLFITNIFFRKTGLLFRWVDKFIAVSNFVKDKYIAAGFPAEKIIVKYNGINELTSTIDFSGRRGLTFVGRLTAAKGTKQLKAIFSNINEPINVVGVGDDLAELQEFCQGNNLQQVCFYGRLSRKDTAKIMACSKCVIVPSQCGETFSLVIAEAMMNAIPVVVSDLGGPEELIEKSGAGLVVPAKDTLSFIEKINQLLHNDELNRQFGQKGRKFFEQNLTQKISIDSLITIYEQTISD